MVPKIGSTPNGNLTGDGTYTYSWNIENQLTGITGGGQTISYKYDYLGRRISKTVNGVLTDYAYDGQNLIAERGSSPVEYFFGPGIDEPLASKIGSNVYYYSVDGLGSDSLVSDSNGTVQNKYVYDAWGIMRNQTAVVANSFGYTAREVAEVGLMYYRARYYNPSVGRFVSEDPLGYPGVSEYSYTLASPVMFSDPSGLYRIVNNIDVQEIRSIRRFRYECGAAAGECAMKSPNNPQVIDVSCICFCTPGGFAAQYAVTLGGGFFVYGGPWALQDSRPCVDQSVVNKATAEQHARGVHLNPAIRELEYFLIGLEFNRYSSYDECKSDCNQRTGPIKGKFRHQLNLTIDEEKKKCENQ